MFTCTTLGKGGYTLEIISDDNNNYGYVLNCNGERTEYYNDNGYLTKIVDKNGFETTLAYTDSLITVTDTVTGKHI